MLGVTRDAVEAIEWVTPNFILSVLGYEVYLLINGR